MTPRPSSRGHTTCHEGIWKLQSIDRLQTWQSITLMTLHPWQLEYDTQVSPPGHYILEKSFLEIIFLA
jgi:hypothetical protein